MNRYLSSTLLGIALAAGPALASQSDAAAASRGEEVVDCASELLSSGDTEACLAVEAQGDQAVPSDEATTSEEDVMDRGGFSAGRGFGRGYGYGYGYGRGYVSRYRGRYYRTYPRYYYYPRRWPR